LKGLKRKLSRYKYCKPVLDYLFSVLELRNADDALEDLYAIVREVSFRVLGLRHYDVQILGAFELNKGCIAEMATGKGKKIVAALPSVLSVCLIEANMSTDEKKAYDSDITYATNSGLGFDYLRDYPAFSEDNLVRFRTVDEAPHR